MAERIKFYFDPICPWCYATSKWAKRLEELGEVELSWGVFSLEIQNSGKEPEALADLHSRSTPAMRVAVALRDSEGEAVAGKFYAAIGRMFWEETKQLNDADVIREAITEAGGNPAIYDKAIADESTLQAIVDEHKAAVAKHGSFGVPTIVLDGGDGLAMFGPVIADMPSDEEAVELFRHSAWLTRYDNFFELKRNRTRQPDLQTIKEFAARRAAAQQAAKSQG